MRIRFFLVMTAVSSVSAGFAIQACGGSSDSGTTSTPDAAQDTSVAADTSPPPVLDSSLPDVADARPPCDPNKDILTGIPDASIPDTGTTTGECLGCATTACASEISACKMDCSRSTSDLGCQDLANQALSCYLKSQMFATCAGAFITAKSPTQGIGIALGTCIGQKCSDQCGVPEGGLGM